MSIRRAKQHSDRGSIKDLVQPLEAMSTPLADPPTKSELRYKKLYEYAQLYKDTGLQEALGVITTDYIGDKTALPLSIYRLRKIVEDIKSRPGSQITKLEEQFSNILKDGVGQQIVDFASARGLIKKASKRKPPVFRRVSIE